MEAGCRLLTGSWGSRDGELTVGVKQVEKPCAQRGGLS